MKTLKQTARAGQVAPEANDPMHRLHTDLLAERYGPVSIRLLWHDNEVREALLIDRQGISRTFAVTFFAYPYPEEFTRIDAEIRGGAPLVFAFLRRRNPCPHMSRT